MNLKRYFSTPTPLHWFLWKTWPLRKRLFYARQSGHIIGLHTTFSGDRCIGCGFPFVAREYRHRFRRHLAYVECIQCGLEFVIQEASRRRKTMFRKKCVACGRKVWFWQVAYYTDAREAVCGACGAALALARIQRAHKEVVES